MKQLRAIRILLAALFLAASAACLLISPDIHPMAAATGRVQIVLSTLSISIGATLVWLLITFLFGRVYCATACPVGTLSDLFLWLGRKVPRIRKRKFSYRRASPVAVHILWIYVLCAAAGITLVPLIVEPWNIARNIAAAANPEALPSGWLTMGLGLGTGVAAGIVSLILLAVSSAWRGREFCSRYCPVGTALGLINDRSIYVVEFDPDRCSSCGICEDICPSQCVKVVSRFVDNSRCVRCMDCVAKCPDDAIKFTLNRHRPATPLFRKVKSRT